MSQPRRWTSIHVVGADTCRLPLAPLAVALPRRWWHTPGRWSYVGHVIPATEFTVAPEDLPETVNILRQYAEVVASDVPPTLLSESLEVSAHFGWTPLLTLGSDRLAHALWEEPDALLRAEVAAVWEGLGGSVGRRTRGIAQQLRWLGAAVAPPTDAVAAEPVGIVGAAAAWTAAEELPLELVGRLAHLQAARVRAGAQLAAKAEVLALQSLLNR